MLGENVRIQFQRVKGQAGGLARSVEMSCKLSNNILTFSTLQ